VELNGFLLIGKRENVMKKIHLALVSLCTVILAAGCGGGGGGSSGGGGGGTPTATVQITKTNASAVAKGGMTTSQTMAKTGSSGAGAVGVVVQPGAPRKSVMDIALAQLRRVQGMKVPAAPAGVVGVSIAPFPVTFGCGAYANTSTINGGTPLNSTNGTSTIDLTGNSTNGLFAAGNVATLTYNACVDTNPAAVGATITTNGSMSLSITSMSGAGTSASPINESVSMSFTGFSTVDTAPTPTDTVTMSGGITLAINDNGTIMTATMSGTSFAMTSTTDGAFTLKNFSIVDKEDSPTCATNNPAPSTVCAGNYSFSVAMTTNMANTAAGVSGDIVISTPIAFTGTGTGDPTTGKMVISGAGGSSVTLTANAPVAPATTGTVTMGVNDGTNPVTTSTVTWAQI
jgi:hypothetical protein